MTEAEWLACDDPVALVYYIHPKTTDRKVYLLACGCCRQVWNGLVDRRSREAVEVGERFADGAATTDEQSEAVYFAEAAGFAIDAKVDRHEKELRAIRGGWLAREDAIESGVVVGLDGQPLSFREARAYADAAEAAAGDPDQVVDQLPKALCLSIIRDIFGNPFRPVVLDPEWRTSTVIAIAQGVYESRDFGAMPILADALQDAGCEDEAVLGHCRDESRVHVRGCWVVDLVLGKS